MGKPTLIIRTKTGRSDGLGENAVLCNNDFAISDNFVKSIKYIIGILRGYIITSFGKENSIYYLC